MNERNARPILLIARRRVYVLLTPPPFLPSAQASKYMKVSDVQAPLGKKRDSSVAGWRPGSFSR